MPISLGANDNKHCYKGSTRWIRFDLKFLFFWYQSQYNILLKTLFEEEEVNHRILDCWWYKQYYTNFTCFITITSWTWWSLRSHRRQTQGSVLGTHLNNLKDKLINHEYQVYYALMPQGIKNISLTYKMIAEDNFWDQ